MVAASDADLPANNLSFSLDAGAPVGATIHPTTGEFNWTPGELERTVVYSVTVRVTDDETPSLDDFETVNITVREVNQAPVLAAIGSKSVDEGSLLTFTASASDPDLPANKLSFSLDAGRRRERRSIRAAASSAGRLREERRRVTTR